MTDSDQIRRIGEIHEVSLADRAHELISRAILDGSLRPDERLTIEGLAADLGVSRTPVREALKVLEHEGLVRLQPHRGAVVEPVALDELHRRYSIRAMLEGYAAELACRSDGARVAGELEANCEELGAVLALAERDGDVVLSRRLADLNRSFHACIHEACGSRTLVRLLGMLRNPLAYTLTHWQDPERRLQSLEFHRQIAAAFRSNRPAAARRLMERHILAARDVVLAHAENHEPGRRNGESPKNTTPTMISQTANLEGRTGDLKQVDLLQAASPGQPGPD